MLVEYHDNGFIFNCMLDPVPESAIAGCIANKVNYLNFPPVLTGKEPLKDANGDVVYEKVQVGTDPENGTALYENVPTLIEVYTRYNDYNSMEHYVDVTDQFMHEIKERPKVEYTKEVHIKIGDVYKLNLPEEFLVTVNGEEAGYYDEMEFEADMEAVYQIDAVRWPYQDINFKIFVEA